MGKASVLFGIVGLLVSIADADAAPLTCAQFQDRLNAALVASADKDVEAPAFTPKSSSPERGKRYDWAAGAVSGTISCGPADQFEEFYAELRFVRRDEFAQQLKRYIALNGAAICSLASDGPLACSNMGKLMLQDTLKQMGVAAKRGSQTPSGLADRTLFPGAKAELTSAPTLFSFALGPGSGATVDEARQSLGPIDLSGAE